MPPLDLLSWEFWVEALGFWARDSESLYRLALIVAGLIGVPLLYSRTRSANRSARAALEQAKVAAAQAKTAAERHDEQTRADRERRITESFAKAVEQLGIDKLETRLGAIYTLERISQESEREYWPIMETLTAYVREHAPWQPPPDYSPDYSPPKLPPRPLRLWLKLFREEEQEEPQVRPATDIQAILTVLGRRDEQTREAKRERALRRLDLAATDLRGAALQGAHLERAVLTGTHLEGANFWRAHLEGARFRGTYVQGAVLTTARLLFPGVTLASPPLAWARHPTPSVVYQALR